MNIAAPRDLPELVNRDLECATIGALLYYTSAYALAQPQLRSGHFSEAFLGNVYDWIGEQLAGGSCGGDMLQLAALQHFAGRDKGKETLAHCMASALLPVQVPDAVTMLASLAERRRLVQAAALIDEQARKGGTDLTSVALSLIADGIDGLEARRTVFTLAEAVALIDAAAARRVSTGSDGLDDKLAGWQAGRFYVIGGRPGTGKTTVALSLLLQSARRGAGVLFFSLEMAAAELAARALADLAFSRDNFVPYKDIERGKVQDHLKYRIDDAKAELAGLPVTINDKAAPTLAELKLAARALQKDQRLDVVVVDHLGHIKPSGDYRGNKVAETGEVSSGLKAFAKDLDVAVVAVCQLNRETEHRESKKPTLADLRWAGEIEQDADVVLMIYRPAYYLEPGEDQWFDEKNKLQVLIRKNRSGETGAVKMFAEMAASHVRDEAWR